MSSSSEAENSQEEIKESSPELNNDNNNNQKNSDSQFKFEFSSEQKDEEDISDNTTILEIEEVNENFQQTSVEYNYKSYIPYINFLIDEVEVVSKVSDNEDKKS